MWHLPQLEPGLVPFVTLEQCYTTVEVMAIKYSIFEEFQIFVTFKVLWVAMPIFWVGTKRDVL